MSPWLASCSQFFRGWGYLKMNEAFCKTLGNIWEKKEASFQKMPRTQVTKSQSMAILPPQQAWRLGAGGRWGLTYQPSLSRVELLERTRVGTSESSWECSWTGRHGLERDVPKAGQGEGRGGCPTPPHTCERDQPWSAGLSVGWWRVGPSMS